MSADVGNSTVESEKVRGFLAPLVFIDMTGIAKLLGVSYHRVKILRSRSWAPDSVRGGLRYVPNPHALPPPLPMAFGPSDGKPKDPIWLMSEIVTWGKQTGRLDFGGTPQRAKPTGRRPKIRVDAPPEEPGEDQTSHGESSLSA